MLNIKGLEFDKIGLIDTVKRFKPENQKKIHTVLTRIANEAKFLDIEKPNISKWLGGQGVCRFFWMVGLGIITQEQFTDMWDKDQVPTIDQIAHLNPGVSKNLLSYLL
jgi:hypothetical protein